MNYSVGIGERTEAFSLPDTVTVDVMHAKAISVDDAESDILSQSIEHPIGTALSELVDATKSICIITSDVTRPVPTARILPTLMAHLHACGAKDENITLAIALGSHRPQTDDELAAIMG